MIGCGSISVIRGFWPRLCPVEGFALRSSWNRVLSDVSNPGGRGRGLIRGEGKRMVMSMTKRRVISNGRCCIASASDDFGEMSKLYDFCSVESTVYEWWERKGFFKPPPVKLKEQPFVIPMPPPNVTGYLHIGHALFVALQDIIARYQRMRGKATLYLPGTDHAGIATQMLVERSLAEEGLCRTDIGRDAFLKMVWSWKEEKGGYIQGQLRRMGASADWTRERFTMDPEMANAVAEAFIRLHQKGLVYKGDYMVNWSPSLQTAISDLEVEYREEMGMLYYFKYMLEDNNNEEANAGELYIPVATTRPETILGDTAVCVNPNDSRFSHLVGRCVIVPDGSGRSIPVISDSYVDVDFGTGAVKITPGHDPNDYEIGKRHNLPIIVMMNKDVSINSFGGSLYEGLDRFECRSRLWEDMRRNGLVISEEEHMQRVPVSQRGGEVIEPMVSTQWFVKTVKMAQAAMDAVKRGEIEIVPERFEKLWYNWLGDGLRDWCVSRQLWWGHRIPVWYVHENGEKRDEMYFVARNEKEARVLASEAGVSSSAILVQEEDVLDTWFR